MKTSFKNLTQFITHFSDETICRQYFEAIRFKDGDYCPHCGNKEIMRFSDSKRYRCHSCRKDFTIKTGTLFGESKISMQKWFIAIYLLTTSKKGVSSIELAEQVGVSQKTAWFMDMRIRSAMKQGRGLMSGTFEVDETYTGGKEKNKHLNKRTPHNQGISTKTKTAVVGIFQRGGEVRTAVTSPVLIKPIEEFIFKNIEKGSKVYTDDALVYKNLKRAYEHGITRHTKGQYVNGEIHSNTAESFWALFKRGYHGTYHTMSRKHMKRYVDEFAFRFNSRNASMAERFETLVSKVSRYGKMPYKTLTA